MARVGRLAGTILVESGARYFLVGNTKEPCDFEAAGFAAPGEIDVLAKSWVELSAVGTVYIAPPWLALDLEGEALAALLARRFLIERNASVSDRLWRLVAGDEEDEAPLGDAIDAQWLAEIPDRVWQIVRDSVLRCL